MHYLGVLGFPISHSLSPRMHHSAFVAMDLEGAYLPFCVEANQLAGAIIGAGHLGFTGLNVTIPHKQGALEVMDQLTEQARLVGAVNTILYKGKQRIGHNTDGPGFLAALSHRLSLATQELRDMEVVVLGAGGAARSIVHELVRCNAQVGLYNRTHAKAEELAASLPKHLSPYCHVMQQSQLQRRVERSAVIINTTSAGMKGVGAKAPLPLAWLQPRHIVFDIVYNPLETPLLKHARQLGCIVENGVSMLVWQGIKAWQFWFGMEPPYSVLQQAVVEGLESEAEM